MPHPRVNAIDAYRQIATDLLRISAVGRLSDRINEVVGHDRDVRRRRRDEFQRVLTKERVWIWRIGDDDRTRREIARLVEHVDERPDIVVVDAIAGPDDAAAVVGDVIDDAEPRAEVVAIATLAEIHERQRPRLLREIVLDVVALVERAGLHVVAKAETEAQVAAGLPVVLHEAGKVPRRLADDARDILLLVENRILQVRDRSRISGIEQLIAAKRVLAVQVAGRIVREGNVAEVGAELQVVRSKVECVLVLQLPAVLGAELVEVPAVGEARKDEAALNPLDAEPGRCVTANVGKYRSPGRCDLIHRVCVLEPELVQPRRRSNPGMAEDRRAARNRLVEAGVRGGVAPAVEACPFLVLMRVADKHRLLCRDLSIDASSIEIRMTWLRERTLD